MSAAPAGQRPRIVRRALHGVLLLDKETGLTSNAAVQRAKRIFRAEKVGHTGTLDPLASGLLPLCFGAATKFAQASLDADKRYLAITRGHPPEHVVIDHAIPKAPGEARIAAVTEIWRRETFGRYALVEARPHTGRLHQIRRHLKHIACPLIGDVRYGKGEHNRLWREKVNLHRLALHSISLRVPHPDGGELAVECPLAEDFAAALEVGRQTFGNP